MCTSDKLKRLVQYSVAAHGAVIHHVDHGHSFAQRLSNISQTCQFVAHLWSEQHDVGLVNNGFKLCHRHGTHVDLKAACLRFTQHSLNQHTGRHTCGTTKDNLLHVRLLAVLESVIQ